MSCADRWFTTAPVLIGWGLAQAVGEGPQVFQVELAAELERLKSQHGFEVRGIAQTAGARARAEGDGLLARLHTLLEDFDHVIVQTPDGGVERLIILGEKVAYVPQPMVETNGEEDAQVEIGEEGEIILPTQRKGVSHTVTLALEGPNRRRVQQALLVDTGADQVVLPSSLLGSLGIPPSSLRNQRVQTANGPVAARVGTLDGVWLGETQITDVAVAFIEDSRLGGQSLLGMSVLGRFLITIDDDNDQLILKEK